MLVGSTLGNDGANGCCASRLMAKYLGLPLFNSARRYADFQETISDFS